jgi:two-component system cell cycle response regulator DivK
MSYNGRTVIDAATATAGRRKPPGRKPPSAANSPLAPAAVVRPIMTVLVVDDVDDTREMYEYYLRFHGFRVVTAADGAAALHAVQFERPDAILLDLAMPKVTGWDVIRALKGNAITHRIPIIVVSGQLARESALSEGADSYLEKPCKPEVLMRELQRVLRDPEPRDQ